MRLGEHYNAHLQSAFDKYGENNFLFEIIESCQESEFNAREIFWIEKYNSQNSGYNLTSGGDCRDYACSEYHFENIATSEVVSGKNLKEFCSKRGIPLSCYSHFTEMMKGVAKRKTCHGWRKFGTSNTPNRMTPFVLQHSSGEIYSGENITEFARQRGLHRSNITALIKGRQKTAYGWTVKGESNA